MAQSNGTPLLPTVFVALVNKTSFQRLYLKLMDFSFRSSHVLTSLAALCNTFPTHFHLFQGYIVALENLLTDDTLNIDS